MAPRRHAAARWLPRAATPSRDELDSFALEFGWPLRVEFADGTDAQFGNERQLAEGLAFAPAVTAVETAPQGRRTFVTGDASVAVAWIPSRDEGPLAIRARRASDLELSGIDGFLGAKGSGGPATADVIADESRGVLHLRWVRDASREEIALLAATGADAARIAGAGPPPDGWPSLLPSGFERRDSPDGPSLSEVNTRVAAPVTELPEARCLVAARRDLAEDDSLVLDAAVGGQGDLPKRVVLPRRFDDACSALDDLAQCLSVPTRVAYSIKTNPNPALLRLVARERDWLAEAISWAEAEAALAAGFSPERIVLNGPGKWWTRSGRRPQGRLAAVFADSEADLGRAVDAVRCGDLHPDLLGIRVAPAGVQSRFGIDLANEWSKAVVHDTLRRAPRIPFGIHFHQAATAIGVRQWVTEACGAIDRAAVIAEGCCTEVEVVDLGGGWPHDAPALMASATRSVADHAHNAFGRGVRLIVEPGRAVAQPAEAVVAEVIELRAFRRRSAVVVNAGVNELWDQSPATREIHWRSARASRWEALESGTGVVLGRLCMEHDVIRFSVEIPSQMKRGDLVAFMNAGAYDASMAFSFGDGRGR